MARLWTCFEGRIQSTCWWKSLALPHSGPPVLSWTLPLLFALLPSLLPIWSQSLNSLIFWFVNDLPVCPWSVYIPPLVLMVSYQLYPRQACAMLLLLIINTSYLCCAFQFRPFGIHYLIWHTRFHGPFHAFHSAPDLREEAWVSFSWISEKLTPWQLHTWQKAGTGCFWVCQSVWVYWAIRLRGQTPTGHSKYPETKEHTAEVLGEQRIGARKEVVGCWAENQDWGGGGRKSGP